MSKDWDFIWSLPIMKNEDEYEEMYGHHKPIFIPEDEQKFFTDMNKYIINMDKHTEIDNVMKKYILEKYILDNEKTKKEIFYEGEKMPKTEAAVETVLDTVFPETASVPQKTFVDCTEHYRPPFVEWAHNNEQGVLIKGKKKDSTNIEIPRLKHRVDLKKYIKNKETLPYVTLSDVNPNCGKTGIWKVLVDILKKTVKNPKLALGYLNEMPVYKIAGQELPHTSCDSCGFKGTCEFAGECACLFRPQQNIMWGEIEDGVFLQLEKPLESQKFTIYEILGEIEKEDGGLYDWFMGNTPEGQAITKDQAVKKLATHLAAMQRVSLDTYNCYGLPFVQCGMALNTEYNDKGEIEVWLSVGETTPKVASWRQYKKNKKNKKNITLDEAIIELSKLLEKKNYD